VRKREGEEEKAVAAEHSKLRPKKALLDVL
jgi:hypothetical protein